MTSGIFISFDTLAGANKTVKNWVEKTFGVNVENVKGDGGGGSGGTSSGGGAGKKAKSPMEELVDLCGNLVESPEGTQRLEMALSMLDLEKASDCPEDKIPKLMAMLGSS